MMVERKSKMADPKDRPKTDPVQATYPPDDPKLRTEENEPKNEEPKKEDEKKKDSKDALDRVVANLSRSSLKSPSQEDSDSAAESLYVNVEEGKEGKPTTVTSSISEEEAKKAGGVETPDYINQRQALDRVPGILNLTMDGTLNSDRSKRMDKTVDELWEILAKTAGENPIPNREGNELTKLENGWRADLAYGIQNRNKAFAKRLEEIEANLDGKDKEDIKKMREQLVGS